MTFRKLVRTVFLTEIIKGMALTLKMLFTRPVTRRYPKVKRPVMPGFRGLHALVRDQQTERRNAWAAVSAAPYCPSQCIYIYTADSQDHKKVVDRYEIEVLRCVFCGLCVEACPYSASYLASTTNIRLFQGGVLHDQGEAAR